MAKSKTKDKAVQAKGKTKTRDMAGRDGSPGQGGTTASMSAAVSAVPCALCRRPVRHEPGPGKAAAALTGHYNDKHQGDERLKDLADGAMEGTACRVARLPLILSLAPRRAGQADGKPVETACAA